MFKCDFPVLLLSHTDTTNPRTNASFIITKAKAMAHKSKQNVSKAQG